MASLLIYGPAALNVNKNGVCTTSLLPRLQMLQGVEQKYGSAWLNSNDAPGSMYQAKGTIWEEKNHPVVVALAAAGYNYNTLEKMLRGKVYHFFSRAKLTVCDCSCR
jgi:hypothetical protein